MLQHQSHDLDPIETSEWIESLDAVVQESGRSRAEYLLKKLHDWANRHNVDVPLAANTPYINTIHADEQASFPGDRAIERRIKSYARWNAMAMVVRANREPGGVGGHISTYASSATLLEVGFNHFFRAQTDEYPGDQIYFQGHGSPGIYARAYLEGRIDEKHLLNFRRELAPGGGLSSYPHPWLMPDFWEYPTVSMGLGPISSIYRARFNHYLVDRGLAKRTGKVWAFLGDGEMDEPESLGAITLASREQLDSLVWVINCNLQRLDGPVRGNGSVIQELEAAFRGAGWNVIKVLWGADWDPVFEKDTDGLLIERFKSVVDGEWQRYASENDEYIKKHLFKDDEKLLSLISDIPKEKLTKMRLGGHDPTKVYAAYHEATNHTGQPTVILARTVKGYGLGEAGEGKNITHQQKKLNDDELKHFRDRFDIPLTDKQLEKVPFCRFEEGSVEYEYLMERRHALGGPIPSRKVRAKPAPMPKPDAFVEFMQGSGGREAATTMAFMRMLARLLKDPELGELIVPIVPDEARTFGMEALFRAHGIYAHSGQLYEPVDSHQLMRYEERLDGQILEEGITECGSMASFTAAGTTYASHGINTIPFFIFYSMFGFQRIGDSIWAAADARCKGFILGATAGRTTLNGEGLQHQDGHSHVLASTVPNIIAYDPAWAFELAIIIKDGIRRMYVEQEDVFYYITLYNEPYEQPGMPDGAEEGILKGMYRFKAAEKSGNAKGKKQPRVHLFGSGPILRQALEAQEILAKDFGVAADLWSITSYNELHRDAEACERWNRLHPAKPQRKPYITQCLEKEPWPVVATSDYQAQLARRLAPYLPGPLCALGTDGFGRSETRENLRRHFEIDAQHTAYAALFELAKREEFDRKKLPEALKKLGLDPEAIDPATA
ncbi:MAG: pyruvate dehydrogenase (acetyl-transferring), homodimeric type [Phycisphaerae bacterium]